MNILLVHNEYAKRSGEEVAFENTVAALARAGHRVRTFVKYSSSVYKKPWGNIIAAGSGIWSPSAAFEFSRICRDFRPQVVHLQNIFPLISPAIIQIAELYGAAIVHCLHNYRMHCPTGLMLRGGRPCEACASDGVLSCVTNRCEGGIFKSLAYALRTYGARRELDRYVRRFIVLSTFHREKLIAWGVASTKIDVIPNYYIAPDVRPKKSDPGASYVAYLGRLRIEKGVHTLLEVARSRPEIPFRLAGHAEQLMVPQTIPHNVSLLGEISGQQIWEFLHGARLVVVPSICYEAQSFSALEAMMMAKPVVASRIGGLLDVVLDGETGRLFAPGNAAELSKIISELWGSPGECQRLGENGSLRVRTTYREDSFTRRLEESYCRAIKEAYDSKI
jgi:glycosyltransferase involved in cell wall biosynthesis